MTDLTPRPGILEIRPHMMALPKVEVDGPVMKLASNESAFGASPKAIAAATRALTHCHVYPEDGTGELRDAIGRRFGLDPARIVCGHGSDELLTRLTRAYLGPDDELVRSAHGYMKFPNYARAVGARAISAPDKDLRADVDAILACFTERTRMVTIANPDNPTGSHLCGAELRRLHAGLPDRVLLVLDSAYAEYARDADYEPAETLVDAARNVVMTRTFSKIFGLAGLRLGWLYGPPAIVDVLNRVGATFPVNSPAIAAGIAAADDTEHFAAARSHNDTWLPWFSQQLKGLGLHVYPSNGNFVLVRFDDPDKHAAAANAFLLKRGIIPRLFAAADFSSHMRITIGRDSEVQAAADALRDFLGS